ncbi:MAG TPA: thioesterase [Alphaproteobacteria bacterium]|nr:thioesterase [Alphaproteobacteria bacterium]
MSDPDTPKGYLLAGVPHAAAIGLHVLELGGGTVSAYVPYKAELIGNPDTGVIHGGVITALLDNCCGIAVASKSGQMGQIATLDLRIDYMKPATPGEAINAFAECYKVTKNIAFVRGLAFQGDRNDPVATCTAAFMLGTKSQPGANLAQKG